MSFACYRKGQSQLVSQRKCFWTGSENLQAPIVDGHRFANEALFVIMNIVTENL